MKSLSPRQRYLLLAAMDGRVYQDAAGRYWLDGRSSVTAEFKALISNGWARDPEPSAAAMRRLLWFSDEAHALAGRVITP